MRRSVLCTSLFLLALSPTYAHEMGESMGFVEGLTHPVLGLDHLLAMVAVGVLAAIYGKRAMWVVPGIFVAGMAVGGTVGMLQIYLPVWVFEVGIAGSVALLGLALALKRENLLKPSMIAVLFFGFFHGFAHGVEMPALASPWVFALGFLSGTTLLHLIGVAVGAGALKLDPNMRALRVAGGVMSVFGIWLVYNVF